MNQLRKLLFSLSLRQQVSIGAAIIAMGAGLWLFAKWNRERDFRPLYANLAAEDAGAVMQKLKEEAIEYRVDDNGTTLRVASSKVAEMRLKMAASGLPKTGRIGFELFDKNSFGLTEFAEQVNYRRAIEGELERSVGSLTEIERARVHISLPKDSVFLESKQEAKASVVVSLRPGARLSAQNGAAITFLVASAVDRLAPESVTVLDSHGNLLVRPRKASADADADLAGLDLEYRQKMERELVAKIGSTLEPLLGADKFHAGASVEVDFTSGEQSEEIYDPSRSVMLTSQTTEDITGVALPSGAPGTASNLPRPPARPAGSGSGTTRKTENVSYQTSRVVKRTRIPQGAIKRLSLSVLLDQKVRWEGSGANAKRVLDAPSPEKLKTVREVVAAATGFSEARGDQLIVDTLPFEATVGAEPPVTAAPLAPRPTGLELPPILQKYFKDMPEGLLIGIGLGGLIIVIAPIVLLLLRRRRNPATAPTSGLALPHGADAEANYEEQMANRAASQQRLEAEALFALKVPAPGTKKSEILAKHLKKAVKSDPTISAQLLRTWMDEEGA